MLLVVCVWVFGCDVCILHVCVCGCVLRVFGGVVFACLCCLCLCFAEVICLCDCLFDISVCMLCLFVGRSACV